MGKVIPHIRQSDLFPRQVERQLKEYIDFIWRSGDQTIGCSQGRPNSAETDERCHLRNLFSIDLLRQEGLVKPEHHFPDGTKNGADANQCAFVWRKSIEKDDQKLEKKFQRIVAALEQMAKEKRRNKQGLSRKAEASPITPEAVETVAPKKKWGVFVLPAFEKTGGEPPPH